MISDIEYFFFMYLLAICMSSLKNVHSAPLPILNVDQLFSFLAIRLYDFFTYFEY